VSASRVFPTIREAIHATATNGTLSMKHLAAELDYSPSELSMRTTLGGDSARPFPADDDHLVRLMKAMQDYSVLLTLADLCGFELQPKKERVAEMVQELQRDLANFVPRVQMLLEIPGFKYDGAKPKARGR
jgi:sugar phosphate isomerase/epimerase